MAVISYVRSISLLILVLCYITRATSGNAGRLRRQSLNSFNGADSLHGSITNDRNNPQQLSNAEMASSQGQVAAGRSMGFYSSSQFKPPTFSGEKPTGWFDTKYPNWVSNHNEQSDKNDVVDGKSAPPSSLQAKSMNSNREDGELSFLQKVAQEYRSRGEKSYSFAHYDNDRGGSSSCSNRRNFNGYVFGKFRCPLPFGTGMNQNDRYCCGQPDYQYCCNRQEFDYEQSLLYGGGDGHRDRHRHSKHGLYPPSRNIVLPIVLPLVSIVVLGIALGIISMYYQRIKKGQVKGSKSSTPSRLNDKYSTVPQDPPVDTALTNENNQQTTNIQA